MLNKIACSYFNSAAISENGELYIWGSPAGGLFGKASSKIEELPLKIPLKQVNSNYKCIHVSMGISHIAVIAENTYIEKVDMKRETLKLYESITKKHLDYFTKNKIDIFKMAELHDNVVMSKKSFWEIIDKINVAYNTQEEDLLPHFVDSFEVDENQKDKINFAQYLYALNPNYFKTKKVLIWGSKENGRLGIVDENTNNNNKEKREDNDQTKSTKKNFIENDDDDEDEEDEVNLLLEDKLKGKDVDKIAKKKTIIPKKAQINNDNMNKVQELTENFILEALDVKKNSFIDISILNFDVQIIKISCGHRFTLALSDNGDVYAWGKGSEGCLGNGYLKDVKEPIKIDEIHFKNNIHKDHVIDIASGAEHCLALTKSGSVYSWGGGINGKLGHGNNASSLFPTRIDYFIKHEILIRNIAAGEQHSASITNGDELYTWGYGANFRLGHGLNLNEYEPKLVIVLADKVISKVSCGALHTLATTKIEGHLYAWGCGINGRLGIDITSTADYIVPTLVGISFASFKKEKIMETCAGPFQSLALTENGDLYAWGATKFQTLGFKTLSIQVTLPTKVNSKTNLKFYYDHENNSKNEMLKNQQKKLLDLKKIFELSFQFVEGYFSENADEFIIKIVANEGNTVFLTNYGHIYICGSGNNSLLGIDPEKAFIKEKPIIKGLIKTSNTIYLDVPYRLSICQDIKFKYIACGLHHILAITDTGKIFGWGRNLEGQLGLGNRDKVIHEPTLVEELVKTNIIMVSCGSKFSAALSSYGDIFVFGTSAHGCLGLNPVKPSYDIILPKIIKDIPPMKQISCGYEHMTSLTEGGIIYTWGNPNHGRLGQGKIEKCWIPKPVSVFSTDDREQVLFDLITAGEMHTIALDTKGNIWSCGAKIYAGLPMKDGNKVIEEQLEFELAYGLKKRKFRYIATNESHSLAISTKGEIYGWGKSEYCKLGQESFINISHGANKIKNICLPMKIDKLKDINVKYVTCGANHSAAITPDGIPLIWGCGLSGRLGISNERIKELAKEKIIKKEFNIVVLCEPLRLNFLESDVRMENLFRQDAMGMIDNKMNIGVGRDSQLNTSIGSNTSSIREGFSAAVNKEKESSSKKSNRLAYDNQEINTSTSYQHDRQKSRDSKVSAGGGDYLNASWISASPSPNKPEKRSSNRGSFREQKPVLSPIEDNEDTYNGEEKTSEMNDSIMQNQQNKSTFRGSVAEQSTRSFSREVRNLGNKEELNLQRGTRKNTLQMMQDNQMPLQRLLNLEDTTETESYLKFQDIQLENFVQGILDSVVKKSEEAKKSYIKSLSLTENLLRTSFYLTNPNGFINSLQHYVPSFLLQNIQLYEGILSHLLIHPCYMKNLLTSKLLDATTTLNLILKIYGTEKNHDRIGNIVLSLAIMILQDEIPNYTMSQTSLFKGTSSVTKLYSYLMSLHKCNTNFLRDILDYIINEVICKRLYEQLMSKFESEKTRKIHMLYQNRIDTNVDEEIKTSEYDNLNGQYQMDKQVQEIEEKITKEKEYIMKSCLYVDRNPLGYIKIFNETDYEKIDRILDGLKLTIAYIIERLNEPEFYLKKCVSKQIKYLNNAIIEEYKDNAREITMNTKTNLSILEVEMKRNVKIAQTKAELLVIDLFFNGLGEMLSDYKYYGIVVKNPKALNMLSEKNLNFFSNVLSKYFQKEIISLEPQFSKLNDYVFTQSRSNEIIQKFIKPLTNYEGYDITMDNISQVIKDAFNFQDKYITSLSVRDILLIHNMFSSIGNKTNDILIQSEATDPLKTIVDALISNGSQIEINAYPVELLQYKLNLKLNIKLVEYIDKPNDIPDWDTFTEHKKKMRIQIHRCNRCDLLFPYRLLRKEDINRIDQGTWKCKLCYYEKNPYGSLYCVKDDCKGVMSKDDLTSISIFRRYYPRILKNKYFENYSQFIKSCEQINETDQHSRFPEYLEIAKKEALVTQDLSKYVIIHELMSYFEKLPISYILGEGNQDKITISIEEKYRLINEVLVQEFSDRKLHKDYITIVESTLKEIDYFRNSAIKKVDSIIRDFEEANKRMIMKNCRDNGIILKLTKDEGDQEDAKLKIKNALESKNILPCAMYRSEDLIKSKTLKKFILHDKDIKKIVTNLKFYFFTDEEENFFVKVIYLENSWLNLLFKCTPWCFINEVGIDEFEISKERFLEMRRTAHYKAEATFGYSTFYVEKLVEILDEILAKYLHNKIKKLTNSKRETHAISKKF